MTAGIAYVLVAGILQGIFLLPMDHIRGWRWEQSWLAFSFFGMLAFNWLFAFMTLPQLPEVYRAVPVEDLSSLAVFGLGWGLGAVLFGLGMARLGLSLGYPIIMGLIASVGALAPLLIFFPNTLWDQKGLLIIAGTFVVVLGIVICSRAAARRETIGVGAHNDVGRGVAIAIAAGVLSCLPNIGMAFGERVMAWAREHGVASMQAANAVWALFFTAGFLINATYCLHLMWRARAESSKGSVGGAGRNLILTALMGLLWIGSFYGYGIGAGRLGSMGAVMGWPLFIATAIVVGNLVGFARGEWRSAPAGAKALLGRGLVVLFAAVAIIAVSGAIP